MNERVNIPPGSTEKLSDSMAFKKRVPILVASEMSASVMSRSSRLRFSSSPSVGILAERPLLYPASVLIGDSDRNSSYKQAPRSVKQLLNLYRRYCTGAAEYFCSDGTANALVLICCLMTQRL